LLLTFEGVEGSGKSTQARRLWKRLRQAGIQVLLTHEPGGTDLGNEIRRSLKKKRINRVSPHAELMLFAASRAQLTEEVIRPALSLGKLVVCDRYAASTIAYQCYGRGLDFGLAHQINTIATQGLKPDLVILLDLPPEMGLRRKEERGKDRFEEEESAFHRRVRQGYLEMAAEEPERWLVIDGSLPPLRTGQIIWQRVSQLFGKQQAVPKR
jgi:dTMP kinase